MASDYEKEVRMTYVEAKEYLKSVGEWEYAKDKDGYSIVNYALDLKEQRKSLI